MSVPTKILITGSSGYLGHFLAVHFAEQGIPVVGVDRVPHILIRDIPNFKYVALDVRNGEVLRRVMEMEQPSHVIHSAFVNEPTRDSRYQHDVNVGGFKNVLEASNAVASVKQLILMSSVSVYGARPSNPDWITEEQALDPLEGTDGVHKKEMEEDFGHFRIRKGLNGVVLRLCEVVGPSYYKKGGRLADRIHAPLMIEIFRSGGKLQFIHEDDVKAIVDIVTKDDRIEGIFNVVPNDFTSVRELGAMLRKKLFSVPLGLLKAVFWVLRALRLGTLTPSHAQQMAYGIVANPKKMIRALDYEFKFKSKEAFIEAVEKRRQNGTL